MMAGARFDVEKFTGHNDFGLWRLKMKAILMQQGLWEILNGGGSSEEKKPELDEKEKAKAQDREYKAYSTLILNLNDRVLREVSKEETAARVWSKLESLYMAKSLANRLHLKQKLLTFKIADGKGVLEQLEEFGKCIDDLENIDEEIKDEDKALMLLNSLPPSYEHFKDAILLGRESKIGYEEVYSALKLKETQKSNPKSTEMVSESLNVADHKKNVKKKSQKKPWKTKATDWKESRSCHYCKKPGHLKKNCWAWKKKQAEEENGKNNADIAEELAVPEALCVAESMEELPWIMDSGCSFHMCPTRGHFEEIKEATGSVLLGNDQICRIRGIGSIKLRLHDGSIRLLTDVRFIPEIKRNLISIGVLDAAGYSCILSGGVMNIVKNGDIVMIAERRRSLYYLKASVVAGSINLVQVLDLRTWHLRLGHLGEAGIKELGKKGLIKLENPNEQLGLCEQCVLGKSKKMPYGRGIHSSTSPLDYAHSDLWGPATPASLGGGKYFLSIIDDFSRKLWVFILREKSETFMKFKEWCKEVEVEKGCSLKCLRTDNGLEFLSGEFDSFCKQRGMKRHRTAPCNPQQNGVAERMNRTILERVRCMLFSSGMPKRFWGEAVSMAAVLINRSPSSAIGFDTPDQRWHGRVMDYSNMRIFGCMSYAHIRQGKLEPRALRCVMIGYQKGVKGYRLWCIEPGNQKVIISRDVQFEESRMPFLEKNQGSQRPSNSGRESEPERLIEVEISEPEETEGSIQVEVSGTSRVTESDQQAENLEEPEIADAGGLDTEGDQQDLSEYMLARDRVSRAPKPSTRYSEEEYLLYALCVAENIEYAEPATFKEAMRSKESKQWMEAMIEEIQSLLKNKTWVLVKRPATKKPISCKWIYKKKVEVGNKIRFKARLVARGFTQEEGIDYNEVFSPVVKHASIRILLAIVAQRNWFLDQLDVKTAFLHGDLEETIYMNQPEGFVIHGSEDKVCLLKKSLYGLKQASRQWHIKFDEHMQNMGFISSRYDSCVYFKSNSEGPAVYLLLYVDDILLAGPDRQELDRVKSLLKEGFEIKDLGSASRILGMDICRNDDKRVLWLSQGGYIQKVLQKYQIDKSRTTSTPLSQQIKLSKSQCPRNQQEEKEMSQIPYSNIVGSVMYMMICTRPDISHAVSVVSRYMSCPGREHWLALKGILKYLKGSSDLGIMFKSENEGNKDNIVGFCDSDYAANLDNRRSQSGYIFTLFGSAVSWKSNLQSVVALSTTEAEYIALAEAVKESFWLKGMVGDFGVEQGSVVIKCDSNSAICLSKHQTYHERSKHIDVRLHFIRDEVEKGAVRIEKVSTEHNAADMLTKALPRSKFRHCLDLVGVVQNM